ncbi:unnamed protein product, partial [Rotaria magnacalcarata]
KFAQWSKNSGYAADKDPIYSSLTMQDDKRNQYVVSR